MRSSEAAAAALLLGAALACGGGGGGGGGPTVGSGDASANVVPITVNGALCAQRSYPNKPCVEVTVCVPGTSQCETVQDVLVDTGSFGLRLFKQAITLPLGLAGATVGECVQFGDGSSDWGPVVRADVGLGGEPRVSVPIQVIDATFSTPPTSCPKPDPGPATAGFNGILGVGVFASDCGSACATAAQNGLYFRCTGAGCAGTTVAEADQVRNPVSALPQDGNGVVVTLPAIGAGGAPSASGALLLGIGTRANNAPAAAAAGYPLDGVAEFTTVLDGTSYRSFVDSGSNGYFFPSPASTPLPTCAAPNASWYCPPSTASLSATATGATGTPTATVPFQVGNFDALVAASSRAVFVELGGVALSPSGFDWGLPFHLGRSVYYGIEGTPSPLGTGPYVGF